MHSLIATYLTIVGMLLLTMFPLLIPAVVSAGHGIWRPSWVCSTPRGLGRLVLGAAR
jgi:hypothetical protein